MCFPLFNTSTNVDLSQEAFCKSTLAFFWFLWYNVLNISFREVFKFMKKDLKTRLVNRKIEKPNQFIMTVGMWVLGIMNKNYKVEFSYDYDPKSESRRSYFRHMRQDLSSYIPSTDLNAKI